MASASPCIYKVPKNLRKVNEAAYTPQKISIGPFYYGEEELADMDNHKQRYKEAFDKRITQEKQEELKNFIIKNEKTIRSQYAEPFEFSSDEFVEMILHDSIFIIELFLRCCLLDTSDFLLEKVWLGPIRRDLQLLENQLPYFVLEGLYNLANLKDKIFTDFRYLSCTFFLLHLSHNKPPYDEETEVKHFVDLIRRALVETHPVRKLGARKKELPNAVKLQKSGVKFKPVPDKYLVEISLEKTKRSLSFFDEVELRIPPIYMYDETESLIRNVMALEQCHYSSETYICSYIRLMNFLLKTEEDVDFLVEKGIIYNFVGSNSEIVNFFKALCRQIPPSTLYYSGIDYDLTRYHDNRWNQCKAMFKLVYFKIAAAVALFTLIQTVFSVLQVFLPK